MVSIYQNQATQKWALIVTCHYSRTDRLVINNEDAQRIACIQKPPPGAREPDFRRPPCDTGGAKNGTSVSRVLRK